MNRLDTKFYWVAVVDWSDGDNPSWLLQPKCVFAKNEDEAKITAMQAISRERKPADLQVIVRPF